ncbi:MAG: rhodanese-like domain-containing protein [Candidatus Moranbacteria bacterium]|nr:rhodanese-like domain-containing protein [Candidatus Moranbacteria bacterium]
MNTTTNKKNIYALLIGCILIVLTIFFSFGTSFLKKEKRALSLPKEEESSFAEASFVSNQELQKMILSDNPLVIDIRSSSDFYSSHIINSLNIESQSVIETLKQILEKENSSSLIIFIGYEEQAPLTMHIRNTLASLFMKKTFFVLSGGFSLWKSESYPIINAGDPTEPSDQAKIEYISPLDTLNLIKTDENVTTLDVRESSLYVKDYIDISKNIPLAQLENKKGDLSRGNIILVYGDTALESFQAGVRLFDMGFFRVLTVNGGYEDLIRQTPPEKEIAP